MPHTLLDDIPNLVPTTIVKAISEVVGDGIQEIMNGLETTNSESALFWDLLNTELVKAFATGDCMAYKVKRGPWQMILLYEKESKCLFSIMREQRFKEIVAERPKRRKMSYLDMLTHTFNSDLQSQSTQLSLFSDAPLKKFEDEHLLKIQVEKLTKEIQEDSAVIQRYVLVLFDAKDYQLKSVRATMVDSNLNVVSEKKWTEYIDVQESVIMERLDGEEDGSSQFVSKLSLTAKGLEKKGKGSTDFRQQLQEEDNNA
ncbi:MAG: DUF5986 family protein [Bacillota bacterium]